MARHRPCSIDGCGREVEARGWCSAHYHRWRQDGDPQAHEPVKSYRAGRTCEIDGCDGRHHALGLCSLHYSRQREGRPLTG